MLKHNSHTKNDDTIILPEYLRARTHGGKKIAVWGCGADGLEYGNYLAANDIEIAVYVDSNAKLAGTLFLGKYPIKTPSEIMLDDEYFVIVATKVYEDEIKTVLEASGRKQHVDYCLARKTLIVPELEYDYLASLLCSIRKHYHCKVLFLIAPNTYRVLNPSELEASLRYVWRFIPNEENHLAWLQSGPPHVVKILEQLPNYSKDYIKTVFSWPGVQANGRMIEYMRDNFNFMQGFRLTTNQPSKFKQRIHYYGASTMTGLGVEDYYTIPSCTQRLVNEKFPDTYYSMNHILFTTKPCAFIDRIMESNICEKDVLIIEALFDRKYIDACAAYGIPCYDLQYLFNRPHNMGEVFYDSVHISHVGNQCIAQKIYELCFDSNNIEVEIDKTTTKKLNSNFEVTSEMQDYLKTLDIVVAQHNINSEVQLGAIVMNCNPFTNGHRYLIEYAAKQVDKLIIFVVQEDKSIFSFADRFAMVKANIEDIENTIVLPSGNFIISVNTLPDYFDKEQKPYASVDASKDLDLFGGVIAPKLNITKRFVGQEPNDKITRQYNEQMKMLLPLYGIDVVEIERLLMNNECISASKVREKFEDKDWEWIEQRVPAKTLDYLRKTRDNTV